MSQQRHSNKKKIKEIVDLWYETQRGYYKKCQEKQHEFVDLMWNLHDEIYDSITNEGDSNEDNNWILYRMKL